jgi:hypothetical protein
MFRRTTALVAVACIAALVAPGEVASGQPGQASAAKAAKATKQGVRYPFEHLTSVSAGQRVPDVLGPRQPALVRASNGGTLRLVKHRTGSAVRFPQRCLNRDCPRVILATAGAKTINSRRHPFTFGATIRVTSTQTSPTSTIIQKGDFTNPRRWRLKLNGLTARPYCLIKGSNGLLRMHSMTGLADGHWHRVVCKRDGRTVSLVVDGAIVATKTGPIGPVRNHASVRIGGTSLIPKNNQFFGALDKVTFKVRR